MLTIKADYWFWMCSLTSMETEHCVDLFGNSITLNPAREAASCRFWLSLLKTFSSCWLAGHYQLQLAAVSNMRNALSCNHLPVTFILALTNRINYNTGRLWAGSTRIRCRIRPCKYFVRSLNSFLLFFFFSQLRCGRGPRPERQASYMHSTSHIRLTSIKKTTPTAAIIAPAANGNSSRQEVALWRGSCESAMFSSASSCKLLQLRPGELFWCQVVTVCMGRGNCTDLVPVEWLYQIRHDHPQRQKVPLGNTRSDINGKNKPNSSLFYSQNSSDTLKYVCRS